MHQAAERHLSRLRAVCAAFLATLVVYGAVVTVVAPPIPPPLPQSAGLAWGLLALALLNLVTLMPVYRAMMAGPRRVHGVDRRIEPLLLAHLQAHIVAYARLEVVSVLGLVLFFAAAREDWFWIFTGAAAVGMLLLWPTREKVASLVEGPAASG
mgnify:CR=1 FL=1